MSHKLKVQYWPIDDVKPYPNNPLDKKWRDRLTVPEIPFSKIEEMGAGMYKGERKQ